jgi:hypothetical protein
MTTTFTHKHYEKLASFFRYELEVSDMRGTFNQVHNDIRVNTIKGLIRLLANNLANDNPKFNTQRFYKAAGLKETV